MELIENQREEIFCLKYELNTLSELLIHDCAERWVYNFMYKSVENDHLERYNFVLKYVHNKNVLDIACGSGYGTFLISTKGVANKVVGVDISENAIRYGNHRYSAPNISRLLGDACEIKFNEKFDIIVSFETIEHVQNYDLFVKNLYENLTKDGILVISTPIVSSTTVNPKNPYHLIEWDVKDFRNLFKGKFEIKEALLQNPIFHIRKSTYLLKVFNKIVRILGLNLELKTEISHKNIVKDIGQYNLKNCVSGYQILVLKKII